MSFFSNSCSFSFEVGWHEFPAGLAIVAALRAFVLKFASAGVAGSAFGCPEEIVGGGRDVMDVLFDETGDECGGSHAERAGKRPKPRRVFQGEARCQCVCLGIVLVHGRECRPCAAVAAWLRHLRPKIPL